MTKYLKAYIAEAEKRFCSVSTIAELQKLLSEHKDKIAFMQHERIVHFLVTMMFALILSIFFAVTVFAENPAILLLVTIMIVLLGFYIKHYYFLENTVQRMYVIYDDILAKIDEISSEEKADD